MGSWPRRSSGAICGVRERTLKNAMQERQACKGKRTDVSPLSPALHTHTKDTHPKGRSHQGATVLEAQAEIAHLVDTPGGGNGASSGKKNGTEQIHGGTISRQGLRKVPLTLASNVAFTRTFAALRSLWRTGGESKCRYIMP